MISDILVNKRASLPLNEIHIADNFWSPYMALVQRRMIPYQYAALNDLAEDAEPSHCIKNLRVAAGLESGTFEGFVCQDTDLAKWLEAVAYSLSYEKNPALEACADEMIELLAKAQEPDGYLDTYFTILHPGKHFRNLKEGHELYTAGHLIEAAVAYYQVTGKRRFLDIMTRCADNICRVFHEPGYETAVPGHEEIELALIKLADATGNEAYAGMALDFVNRRGVTPNYLETEHTLPGFVDVWHDRNPYLAAYGQTHLPVREQTTAEGHAVRALYLYSAMADLAERYHDEGLMAACERLYENIVSRRMYITGGVGSSGVLERFTTDFHLPNDSAYSESCAAIALALFCRRMAKITGQARYMDTAELALMNTVLSGVALDGKSFFYVNPLQVIPGECLPATDKAHVKPVRQKWFGCACCPPNIARTLSSLGEYVLFGNGQDVWLNLFVGGTYCVELGGVPAEVQVDTAMPYGGSVMVRVKAENPLKGTLYFRIPDYAVDPVLEYGGMSFRAAGESGYAAVPVSGSELTATYRFAMPAKLIYADPRVAADAGKCAVKKGPLVYCLEEQDNGDNLSALLVDAHAELHEQFDAALGHGAMRITAQGWRQKLPETLYSTEPPKLIPCQLHFVPYCLWGNRTPGQMEVWMQCRL